MPTAESIARYFLHLAAMNEEFTPVTQMQLHKLLYYAQGWQLGASGKPLFSGRIQAWAHGPVVVEVYPKFADYEGRPIPLSEAAADSSLSTEVCGAIRSTWDRYGRFSAWKLREMSHRESPWIEARAGAPAGFPGREPITNEAMRKHFEPLYAQACASIGLTPRELNRRLGETRQGNVLAWEELIQRADGAAPDSQQSSVRRGASVDGPSSPRARRAG